MNRIGVIDYDAGNTRSVIKALEFMGKDVILSKERNALLNCSKIIFPGVGAYFDAMNKLKEYDLIDTIDDIIKHGIPFMGICLGMQLLFDSSEETIGCSDQSMTSVKGLGILPGHIQRFSSDMGLKIPHMGWNSLSFTNPDSRLFAEMPEETYMYFVHSYYLKTSDRSVVSAQSEYGIVFDCAVEKDNVFGCQFHPEKSGEAGLKILNNFCSLCE